MKTLHISNFYALSLAFATHLSSVCGFPAISELHKDEPSGSSSTSTLRLPHVKIQNGTVVGRGDGRIDTFTAIPFAEPPTKENRLKPPRPLQKSFGTLKLPNIAPACPQMSLTSLQNTNGIPEMVAQIFNSSAAPLPGPQNEDCLTVSITRPAGVTSGTRLPVLFWIFGGGFEVGSVSTYNATSLVKKSVEMGAPVIYVNVNYRLGAFGFLAGKELQKDRSTNLGLRDQRLALEWVSENIEAFGGMYTDFAFLLARYCANDSDMEGDPTKVTLWGESAGSWSVYDQLLVNGGDHRYKSKPLFRGAIMASGSIFPAIPVDTAKAQRVYDQVVEAAGCSKSKDSLRCLRSVPFDRFSNASNSLPDFYTYQGLQYPYIPRPDPASRFFASSPEKATEKGLFAPVPVIMTDQEDEGTGFVLQERKVTSTKAVISFLETIFPRASKKQIAGLVKTYPEDPAAGSPFRTGSANQLHPQFKRLAAMFGDFIFTLRRREALATLTRRIPAWSYISSAHYGFPILGTFHSSDLNTIYQANTTLGTQVATYFLNFVNTGNPNGPHLHKWPKWNNNSRQLLNISSAGISLLKDDFRQESYNYLVGQGSAFAV